MNKQIVITGGLGFIGQHLIKWLIKDGFFPIIIDNLSVGSLTTLRLFPKSKFAFIKCDITDKKKLEKSLRHFRPKAIVHLAALNFIPYCDLNPEKTLLTNILGTQILLDIAFKKNIKNFIFASSAAVYKLKIQPHKEIDFCSPVDVYGLSKKVAEEIIKLYGKYYNIKFVILRIFNVYGPNDLNLHIIPNVLQQLKKSNSIKLGRLNTFRDYIYVDDVIKALVEILISRRGFDNSIYNIGTGKKYSGHSLIKIISKIIGKKIIVCQEPTLLRKTDKKILVADITKFSKIYSWKPKYNIYNGLKELIGLTFTK